MLVQIAHFLSILSTGLFFTTFLFSFFFSNKDINITKLISRIYSHGFLLLLTSFLIYVSLALDDNFSVLYIAQHSNSLLPNFYKVTSIITMCCRVNKYYIFNRLRDELQSTSSAHLSKYCPY